MYRGGYKNVGDRIRDGGDGHRVKSDDYRNEGDDYRNGGDGYRNGGDGHRNGGDGHRNGGDSYRNGGDGHNNGGDGSRNGSGDGDDNDGYGGDRGSNRSERNGCDQGDGNANRRGGWNGDNRGDGGRNEESQHRWQNYQDKFNQLRYKTTVTGPPKKFKAGEDVRAFLSNMEFLIDYYGHDEEEARMFLYNQFEDNGLKMTVSDIMRQNRGCTIPELMAQLSIGLGAKSRAIILAESRNMKRHDGEAVQPFGMRVIDITQRKVLSDPNGKILLESDYVTEDALNTFYRGLRSKKFVEECLDQDAKSIQDAIVIITNYTARRIRLEECISDKEISFSSDKELFQHPEKGKFFVNAIFTANELDMNGNVAVDREDFIWLL